MAVVHFDDNSGKKTSFAGKNLFLPAKTYFWQCGFYHGKNRLPPSGKNLPTLQLMQLNNTCSTAILNLHNVLNINSEKV